METRHILIDSYPESKYFTTHLAELGFAYETIADFRTAAEWYEKNHLTHGRTVTIICDRGERYLSNSP